jgi:hypothetical protein
MEAAIGIVVGCPAPALSLHTPEGRRLALADLRGRTVVVAIFSGARWAAEPAFPTLRERLRPLKAAAIVVSDQHAFLIRPDADTTECSPPGEIAARLYGRTMVPGPGLSVAVVDPEGVVRFAHRARTNGPTVTDGLAETLQAAARRLCPPRRPGRVGAVGTREWKTLSIMASFVLAFIDGSCAQASGVSPRRDRYASSTNGAASSA